MVFGIIPEYRSASFRNQRSASPESPGVSFLGSYTYGHALDNALDANLGSAHAGDTFRDPQHESWEYGNSDFDIRQRFVFSGIYDLPFGRGRRFAPRPSTLVNAVIGGWQLNGILSKQTGYWFTPFGVNDSCFCEDGNANSLRPDVVPGQNQNAGPKTAEQWFNLDAFNVDVPAGRHGNAGRNNILGPGLANLDLGLHKEVSLHESLRLQFRGDFFNALNHVNLNAQVTDYSNANIGKILTSTGGRELQLALKLLY
jgi:hypothetical protein